jgi:hypothetical protein
MSDAWISYEKEKNTKINTKYAASVCFSGKKLCSVC